MTSTNASNPLGSLTDPTSASTTVNSSAMSQLNQNDFLRLMTTQLTTQDPFNPVDNTQMVAQMAQFSSVAGISQMNTTLTQIADKLGATSASDALSYVGKTVLAPGNVAYGRTSGGIAGAVQLGDDALLVGPDGQGEGVLHRGGDYVLMVPVTTRRERLGRP